MKTVRELYNEYFLCEPREKELAYIFGKYVAEQLQAEKEELENKVKALSKAYLENP